MDLEEIDCKMFLNFSIESFPSEPFLFSGGWWAMSLSQFHDEPAAPQLLLGDYNFGSIFEYF